MYMDKPGKDLKEDYQWQLKAQYRGKLLTGDIEMRLVFFHGDKRVHDIDNYNKFISLKEICSPCYETFDKFDANNHNDIFQMGVYGCFMHYNGSTWYYYNNLEIPQSEFYNIDYKENNIAMVGYTNNIRGLVVRGKRN